MRLAAALLFLWAAGCDVERTVGLSFDPTKTEMQDRPIHFSPRTKVDLLLVIDDSGSMAPKQLELREALPGIASLTGTGSSLDLQIGVVTTDLGAPGITCGSNRGAKLQAKGAAAQNCSGPVGAPWLSVSPTGDNLPMGQSVVDTVSCMTEVGDQGCGFEMPLEAAYRALHDPIAENIGFLRDDALLTVLFLTDEDDCSVDQQTSTLFGPDSASFGPLNSFRCTRFGIACDGQFPLPVTPTASFTSCTPATTANGTELADLTKYQTFFGSDKAHGGVKVDPGDVLLAAIRAPSTPFGTAGGTGEDACGAGVASCTVLAHSCSAPADSSFFGDPAVRIDALVNAQNGVLRSICNSSYVPFVTELSTRIAAATAGAACIPGAVVDEVTPNCTITSGGTDVPPCSASLDASLCWSVDFGPDCPAQLDPRSGELQLLHIRFEGALRGDEQGSCEVLSASS